MEKRKITKQISAKIKKKKIVHYVDKVEMCNEIRKYKNTGVMSEKLGKMFLDIANRYIRSKASFCDYTEIDDFVGDAILRMVSQVDKFDTERKDANAFYYFSLLAHRMTLSGIKKFNRGLRVKNEMVDSLNSMLYDSNRDLVNHD